ncbi:MAG: molybdate ABC transporter substrate-binding protein [Rubrivivax sp.]
MRRRLLLVVALALGGAAAAAPVTITVSAAASLADVAKGLAARFEAAHPGTTVRLNLGASGQLLQQIVQGAPVDVLATADAETLDRGIAEGVIEAPTRRAFARNEVVLVVPATASVPVHRLADLARPGVARIAIGKPATVAAGRVAWRWLEQAGLAAALQARVVPSDTVRQALDYVARGEVDAAFVFRTDARTQPERVRLVPGAVAPDAVVYPAAVVSGSRQPAAARAFVDFLLSAEAQELLARHGFARP